MSATRRPASGRVLGHGVDIVEVSDFARLLQVPARQFIDRHFTPAELLAAGEGVECMQRLAARFAVKEAVMKALGVGWGAGVAFTDVEVVVNDRGAPSVVLHRNLAAVGADRGIASWMVTTSHSANVAVASVIALS